MDDIALRLRGVVCATVTPFRPDQCIDWGGLRGNIEWLIGHNVTTLVINGSIGEYASMQPAERRQVVEESVAAVAGRAMVIVGCSDTSVETVIELSDHALRSGADAVMLLLPYYFGLTPAEMLAFFETVDRSIGLPFIVYNNPSTARSEIPIDTIEDISRLSHFAGLKEASSDVLRFWELIRRFGHRFPVIAASESPLFYTLAAGAPGCLTATAAFAPELLAALMEAFNGGDLDAARVQFDRLHAFRRLLQPRLARGQPAYVPYTKAAMNLIGLAGGAPRAPLAALSAPDVAILRDVMRGPMGLSLLGEADEEGVLVG